MSVRCQEGEESGEDVRGVPSVLLSEVLERRRDLILLGAWTTTAVLMSR